MKRKQIIIDLTGVRSARDLHRRLAEGLPVPDGYGCNYDALFDVLTEFGGGLTLVLRNASAAFKTLRRVCADAVQDTPGLLIAFENGSKDAR